MLLWPFINCSGLQHTPSLSQTNRVIIRLFWIRVICQPWHTYVLHIQTALIHVTLVFIDFLLAVYFCFVSHLSRSMFCLSESACLKIEDRISFVRRYFPSSGQCSGSKYSTPLMWPLSRALSKAGLITFYRGCNHHKVLVQRRKLQLKTICTIIQTVFMEFLDLFLKFLDFILKFGISSRIFCILSWHFLHFFKKLLCFFPIYIGLLTESFWISSWNFLSVFLPFPPDFFCWKITDLMHLFHLCGSHGWSVWGAFS